MDTGTHYTCRSIAKFVGFFAVCCSFATLAAHENEFDLRNRDYAPERIAELVTQLDSDDADRRNAAMQSLQCRGPESRPSIPKLIKLLSPKSSDTAAKQASERSHFTLMHIGTESIGPLAKDFEKISPEVQWRAVRIAQSTKARGWAFMPVLVRRFQMGDDEARSEALEVMADIDTSGTTVLPLLIGSLRGDQNEPLRVSAAASLGHPEERIRGMFGKPDHRLDWFRLQPRLTGEARDALLAALSDRSSQVRALAAVALSNFPEAAPRAAPALVGLLQDNGEFLDNSRDVGSKRTVSEAAGDALADLHTEADAILALLDKSPMVPAQVRRSLVTRLAAHSKQPLVHLQQILESDQPWPAISEVAKLGGAAQSAVPVLSKLALNKERKVAHAARMAIACIDPAGHPEAVKATEELVQSDPEQASVILLHIGPSAMFALPVLIEQLEILEQSEKRDQKRETDTAISLLQFAIESIGPAAVSGPPELIQDLDRVHPFIKWVNVDALVTMGSPVVPFIVARLNDPAATTYQRAMILLLLGRFDTRAEKSIPSIVPFTRSPYPEVRVCAARAIGKIVARRGVSLAALMQMYADPRAEVRAAAATSCGAFGKDANSHVSALAKLLADDYVDVKCAAATALGQIGPAASDAIPQLEILKASSDLLLSQVATTALRLIRAKSQ